MVRRTSAFPFLVLVSVLVAGLILPAVTAAADPPGIDRFMRAVGTVESGGRYTARNPVSGAYGKYQIIPSSWRAWARAYLGNANAAPTPRNQERVARAKMRSLHRWLDNWRLVAHWWLTGRAERDPGRWSNTARRYVGRVMSLYKASGGAQKLRVIQETSGAISYTGRWTVARHAGYSGDRVRYARSAGATATLTFTGRRISWIGPVGPTRGRARVYVDGKAVRTVNLSASRFRASKVLFSASFAKAGKHQITIEVLGTTGQRLVAIDAFAIRK